ncbi:MAG: hypothetical protein ACOCRC_00855 [Halodesulfurarchaeum sp.]
MADNEKSDDESPLADVPDGSGCTEIWERLSEQRGEGATDGDED